MTASDDVVVELIPRGAAARSVRTRRSNLEEASEAAYRWFWHLQRSRPSALASCGGSDSAVAARRGGTLNGTYASFPDYLDPALSYTAEGWTAMYERLHPAAHLRARQRRGRQRGHPRPRQRPAEDQQRRQDLHAASSARPQILRRHPGQGLRLPLRGRTDVQAQLRRLALLHRHRRRRKIRRNQKGRHPGDQNQRQDRRNRHRPDRARAAPSPTSSA